MSLKISATVKTKQGINTGKFGEWLTDYMMKSAANNNVYYDHGNSKLKANVKAATGFYGDNVSNATRLADVDVMIVNPDKTVNLLIEIEERACSPKEILGDVLALMLCNQFSVHDKGKQSYFKITEKTKLVVAGFASDKGKGLKKILEVLALRLKHLEGARNGISPSMISLCFTNSIDKTIESLEQQIKQLFPQP